MRKPQNYILFLTFIILFTLSFLSIKKVMAENRNDIHIYLDAGHGGYDGGASSFDEAIIEKDITLKVVLILKDYLEKTGFKVSLTRKNESALARKKKDDMIKRVDLINKSNCSLFISIHANSYQTESVFGAQTFYNKNINGSKDLSKKIMNYLQKFDPTNKRREKEITGKYLFDKVEKTGCLIEIGFLTSPKDLKYLTNEEELTRLSLMIYLGIIDYLEGISYE